MKRFSLFLLSFLLGICFSPSTIFAYQTNMNASVVIGQADFTQGSVNRGGSAAANTLNTPIGVSTDGIRLAIAERNNSRIVIYNTIPTTNGTSADVVVGQSNFTGISANQGGSAAASTLNQPWGVLIYQGKLIITDKSNNRVLIYNRIPTSNNASADIVVGQPDMTTVTGALGANRFNGPAGVDIDPQTGKMVVTDQNNNRILIYNSIPTSNGASADVVVGQTDFVSNSQPAASSSTIGIITQGGGIARIFNGKLISPDASWNRTLIWNTIPTSNGSPADTVIGQTNFTNISANQGGSAGANTLNFPWDMAFDGKRLYMSENINNRILIYNNIPTSNNASAYMVLGQSNFSSTSGNQGSTTAANSINVGSNRGGGLTYAANKLIYADSFNHRVLIYNNVTDTPSLSLSNTITSAPNNKLRFNGTTTTNTSSSYIPTNVDYSVNRSSYQSATPKDGAFDSVREDYYFDFSPSDNGYTGEGYTVKVRSRNSNVDQTDTALFFQPFTIVTPTNNSSSSNGLPSISFKVNKDLFSELKENLSKFQVLTRRSGEDWRTYLDTIPVSYENSKENSENISKTLKSTDGKGNGTYETNKLTVVYSNDNSTITVTPKAVDSDGNITSKLFPENSQRLASGVYAWKVVAVDKVGHTQETETRTLKVSGTLTTNSGMTSGVYFPLSLLSLSTSGINNISTNYPQGIQSSYSAFTTTPILKGIAFSGATITLNTTDTSCVNVLNPNDPNCMKTQTTTTGGDSRFSMTVSAGVLRFGKKYTTSLSVAKDGQFNALPDFTLSIVASQAKK